ncbi:MAG: type IX secretion system PorP/SprF family membrane protein [Parvicellaceae bacterium]|jgi:type IX secretion system PorP/SprF family membrane protein
MSTVVYGQQLPISNFSEYAHSTFNPSLAGQMSKMNVSLIHRSWWSGINNSPSNQWLVGECSLNEKNGIGIAVNRDVRGLNNRINVNGNYSYGIKLTDDSRLLFGLGAKWEQYSVAFENSVVVDQNDPVANMGTVKESVFDANFGMTYVNGGLLVGLSSLNLLGMDSENTFTNLSQNYFFHVSNLFELTTDIDLTPSLFVRYMDRTPIAFMADVNVGYKDFIEIGIGYNHGYAINANLALYYKNFYMGYSYDIGINGVSNLGLGHEVMIGFRKTLVKRDADFVDESGFFMTEEEATKKVFELIDEYFVTAESSKSEKHKQYVMEKLRTEIHKYLPYISKEQREQLEGQILK